MKPKAKQTTCIRCGRPRPVGGKAKSGVCQQCFRATQKEANEIRKIALQHAADRDAHIPDRPWWIGVPRSEWSDRIAEQLPRFQAMGIGKLAPVIGGLPPARRGATL